MNTFWLKIAGVAVAVVVVVVLIGALTSEKEPQSQEPEKGYWDQVKEDRERLTAEPQPKGPAQAPHQTNAQQTIPTSPPQQPTPQFKKLSFEQEVEAQRLWEWVVNQRSMGRLPVMGYGQMVKACRDIKHRWPGSKYAFFATRALADLPAKYQKMYNITKEEIDLENF
jgi:hypothetical protein